MTKKEAHKLMKAHKEQQRGGGDDGSTTSTSDTSAEQQWRRDDERWFGELVQVANEVIDNIGASETWPPEKVRSLAAVAEPDLLPVVRAAGEALIKLADQLEDAVSGEDEEAAEPDATALAALARDLHNTRPSL